MSWLLWSWMLAATSLRAESAELSLADAIARAAREDQRQVLTFQEETLARRRAQEALGRALPALTLGATITRNAKEVRVGEGDAARVVSPLLLPQGNANARAALLRAEVWPETWGSHLDAEAEGKAQAEAREALLADVAGLYLDVVEAQGLTALQAEAEQTAASLVRLVEAQVRAGTRLPADLEQARAEGLRARAARAAALGHLAERTAALALRIGADPDARFIVRCAGCIPPARGERGSLRPLAGGLPDRTDLMALKQRVDAATAREWAGWARFLPTLEVLGNVRLAEPTLFNPELVWWNAQLVASWELFSGTRDLWAGLARRTERERAMTRWQLAEAEAAVAWRQAEALRVAAHETVQATEARVAAVERAYETLDTRFREGLVSAFELTEMARRKNEAAADALRAQVALERAQLQLRRALGLAPLE